MIGWLIDWLIRLIDWLIVVMLILLKYWSSFVMFRLTCLYNGWLIYLLRDRPRLIYGLFDWFMDWLIVCFIFGLNDKWLRFWCIIDWLIGWMIDWLIDWLIGCQVEETDIPGFRSDQQTFFAGNTDFDQILQVGDVPLGGSYLGRFFFIFSFRVKISHSVRKANVF